MSATKVKLDKPAVKKVRKQGFLEKILHDGEKFGEAVAINTVVPGLPPEAAKTAVETTAKVATGAKSVGEFIEDLTQLSTWLRIGKILAAAALLIFALYLFARAISAKTTTLLTGASAKLLRNG
jgi:hypothetical protein